MKKRGLWLSLLTACMAVCVCFGLTVNSFKAKAAIADMTKVDTAIDCAMPLEEGKVKNITSWGYYDSDGDGVGDVWAFAGDGTATAQPEIRFSTPGTNTVVSSASRVYCPISVNSISFDYNITNTGTELAESSTTSYLLQILGALEGTGSLNAYYYHIPEIVADGEWHTLTITLDTPFDGSKEGLATATTFADISDIVCCVNFKIGVDFNGEVLIKNFNVVEKGSMTKVDTPIDCAMPLEEGKVKNMTSWGYYDSDSDGVGDVWAFTGDGTATAQPEIRFSTPGTNTVPSSASRVYSPISVESISFDYNVTNTGTELAEASTTSYLLQILGALEGTGSLNAYYYHVPEIVADGEWHTLTITLDTPFEGSKEGLATATTFDDISDIVCCLIFKIGQDFNGEVLIKNFNVVEKPDEIRVTSTHDDLWNHDATAPSGMYFRVKPNGAPYAADWSLRYVPKTNDAVQFIRDGVTTNVGNTGAETLVKCGEEDYFLESWAVGVNDHGWQIGDVYVLNGEFYNEANNATIVFVDARLEVINVVDNKPVTVKHVEAIKTSQMSRHNARYGFDGNGKMTGFYFTLDPNVAPFLEDWSLEYKPLMADNVVLTRNGVSNAIADTRKGTIVKITETAYYLKMDEYIIGSTYFPMVVGDQITIKGKFIHDDIIIEIPETTATIYEGGVLYSTDIVVDAGFAVEGSADGRYFNTEFDNGAPVNDWHYDFEPMSIENIRRIRDGVTENVSVFGARQIVKHHPVKYYLDNSVEIRDGDIIIIKGLFHSRQNQYVLNFAESYFKVVGEDLVQLNPRYTVYDYEGNVVQASGALAYGTTLSALGYEELPALDRPEDEDYKYYFDGWYVNNELVDVNKAYEGDVAIRPAYSANVRGPIVEAGFGYLVSPRDNYYFSMDENDAPFNHDWSLRYKPMTIDAVKLIRGDKTYLVANLQQETIVKYDYMHYFLEVNILSVEGGAQDGDIFVIDGFFKRGSGDDRVVIRIYETYLQVNIAEDGTKTVSVLNPAVVYANEDGSIFAVESFPYGRDAYATMPGEPATPVEDHYEVEFAGWYRGEEPWNFESVVTECMVLSAKFNRTPVEYQASFMLNGELYDTVTYTVESNSIDLPAINVAPDQAGYKYVWEAFDIVPGGLTVNAKVEAIVYTVNFVADGATVDTVTFTVETLDAIVFPAVPEKEGFTAAWDLTAEDITLADVTVTAIYTAKEPESDSESTSESTSESASESIVESESASESIVESESSKESVKESGKESNKESVKDSNKESNKESKKESAKDSNSGTSSSAGCLGSIGATSVMSMLALAAVAIIRKKR